MSSKSNEQISKILEEHEKEDQRLMRFELKFELLSPSLISRKGQVSRIFLQGYEYNNSFAFKDNKEGKGTEYEKRNERITDIVNYKGNQEMAVQNKITFVKTLGGPMEFVLGAIQKWKLALRGTLDANSTKEELQDDVNDEKSFEIGTVSISIAEMLMELERCKVIPISFNHENTKSSSGDLKITLITPPSKTHLLPRNINDNGTHLTMKHDIADYGDVEAQQMSITLKLMIKDIPVTNEKKGVNPYFVVFKDSTSFKDQLYKSEYFPNCNNATFRTFSFGLANSNSIDKPMLIEFWHHNDYKKDEFIGIMRTDIYDLRNGSKDFNLIDPDIPYEFRGTVHVLKYEERIWPSFKVTKKAKLKNGTTTRTFTTIIHKNDFSIMNYLGYYELRLAVAVDFTASNGQFPKDNKKSLHYIGPGIDGIKRLNPYQQTLKGVTDVVYQYGQQKYLETFGFGVMNSRGYFRMQKVERVSVEKPVNDSKTLLKVYKNILKKAEMGMDNEFYDIIEEVRSSAHKTMHYYILLIVLDGDKVNIARTMNALKETEKSGMSIIFVGVGKESFKNLLLFQRENQNVTFVRYIDDIWENTKNALKDVPKHMLYHMAIRKNVPEIY